MFAKWRNRSAPRVAPAATLLVLGALGVLGGGLVCRKARADAPVRGTYHEIARYSVGGDGFWDCRFTPPAAGQRWPGVVPGIFVILVYGTAP